MRGWAGGVGEEDGSEGECGGNKSFQARLQYFLVKYGRGENFLGMFLLLFELL